VSRARTARRAAGCVTAVATALRLMTCCAAAGAEPLNRRIPDLFGGALMTSIDPLNSTDAQTPLVATRFRELSAALAAARSQAPVPSASGAFSFEWDPDLDTFVRYRQSLGSGLAERAQTLGRHTATLSVSYTHIDFDTLEGDRLDRLQSVQPPFSESFLKQLPLADQMRAQDNVLRTNLSFGFGFDLLFFTAAYGVTDSLDVSMALSVNLARMRAAAVATIDDPSGNGGAFFTVNQKGVDKANFLSARDGFSASAFGTGDLFLRSKWHVYDTEFADFAVAGVLTLPTGNADDFLGFYDPTFTPWLIASKTFGRVSPHLNLGYAFRSGRDVSQAEWIAGADLRTYNWLTLAADFLGYHDDKRDGINDDVLQSAIGVKLNPFGQVIFAGNLQFPLNRDGLRADVIYTGQMEYTF
jgi:hypothetical protein